MSPNKQRNHQRQPRKSNIHNPDHPQRPKTRPSDSNLFTFLETTNLLHIRRRMVPIKLPRQRIVTTKSIGQCSLAAVVLFWNTTPPTTTAIEVTSERTMPIVADDQG